MTLAMSLYNKFIILKVLLLICHDAVIYSSCNDNVIFYLKFLVFIYEQ